MSERRFKSKVDLWIGLMVGVVIVLDIVVIAMLGMDAGVSGLSGAILVSIALIALLFLLWLSLHTFYIVDQTTLRVVSGPFGWRIPLDQIKAVTPSRSLMSAPALSLDRLRIEYGDDRRVLVSPADKQAFLAAIGQTSG